MVIAAMYHEGKKLREALDQNNKAIAAVISEEGPNNNPGLENNEGHINYKNWRVELDDDEITIFHTSSDTVAENTFGWYKVNGDCEVDLSFLGIRANDKMIEVLEKLKTSAIPLKISFPETQIAETYTIETSLDEVVDTRTGNKVVLFTSLKKNLALDKALEHFHEIKVEIAEPFDSFFGVASDIYSLDGYIASKLKAQEVCESKKTENTTSL